MRFLSAGPPRRAGILAGTYIYKTLKFFFLGMQTTLMQEKRDLSFDAFKGIAIIAVIAIHAIYAGGSPYSPSFVYYRQLLNFSVPLFFFIAGYWSSKAKIESLR